MIGLLGGWSAVAQPPVITLTEPEPVPSSAIVEVLGSFAHEPTIAQVHRWAAAHVLASPDQVTRWLRQATRFAALPQTTLEWRLTDGFDQRFDYYNANGDLLLPGDTPLGVIDQATQDLAVTYRVRLDWDLGELVMSSERIRVLNEAQDLVELRDEVLDQATRLYYERRRLQVDELLQGASSDLGQAVRDELRLQELTARLDAVTGGAFVAALADPAKGK